MQVTLDETVAMLPASLTDPITRNASTCRMGRCVGRTT